jgi:predicted metal-dependent hydrolase
MIENERSSVRFGNATISYAIRRSPRRGTVAVVVEPTGEVHLTAPLGTPVERLDRVVHQKARWIVERWRHLRALPSKLPDHEFVSGETFRYLGRQYRLRVQSHAATDTTIRLNRGWLIVSAPRVIDAHERRHRVRAALVDWYRQHAALRLPELVDEWRKRIGVSEPKVLVREQKKRWASCDASGVVRFNWRIIQAPKSLIEYVVAHELVHLRHRHHTAAYWAALGKALPTYEARRARLASIGSELAW